jgi:flagellar hook assembly protein FlgD
LNTTNLGKDTWMIAPNPVPLESEPVHFVYNSANPGTAKVRIYSLSGSLITSFEENIQAGLHEFTWNGNNSYNQTIANGVYLVIVTVEDNAGNKYTTRLKLAVLN